MSLFANYFDKKVQFLMKGPKGLAKTPEYQIGNQMLEFLYSDESELLQTLMELEPVFPRAGRKINDKYILTTDNAYFYCLYLELRELNTNNALQSDEEFIEFGRKYLNEIGEVLSDGNVFKSDYKSFVLLAVYRARALRKAIEQNLAFCLSNADNKDYQEFTPAQRLFLFEKWQEKHKDSPQYFGVDLFPTRLILDKEISNPEIVSFDDWVKVIKKESPSVLEVAVLDNLSDLMRFELMKIIMDNVEVKRCSNCGRLFVPEGRSDIEFCDRPIEGRPGRTCQNTGPLIKHEQKVNSDPVYKEYLRAYKRLSGRVHNGAMKKSEFETWSREAQSLRNKCMAGELSKEEYFNWLDESKVYKKKNS